MPTTTDKSLSRSFTRPSERSPTGHAGASSYDDAPDTTRQEALDGCDSSRTPLRVVRPGRQVTLPASIGAEVTLDVADLLKAGQHRK
ncbi:hypothetical protein [Streptomyces sp900116325]|uniref:hypothetical protein n=1 Tax=Streptomyces sp. 900116325 TaxID=3154295 RepID=UPI0033AE7CC5